MTYGQYGGWRGLYINYWSGSDRPKVGTFDPLEPHVYSKWKYSRVNPNRDYWAQWAPWTSMDGNLRTKGFLETYVSRNKVNGLTNFVVRKLTAAVSQQQYLADLYEAKSAVDLVTVKLGQLLKITKSLKKFPASLLKFKGKKAGDLVFKPKHIRGKGRRKNRKKVDISQVPAEWLTYWFGIAPTIGSISGLAETFDVPFEPFSVRGKSPVVDFSMDDQQSIEGQNITTAQVSFRCSLQVKNPNVGIIDRMGLRNVVSTVWEVAPWSWAVDYFGNMGELFSNFDGLFNNVDVMRASWTWHIKRQWYSRSPYYPWDGVEVGTGFTMERFNYVPLEYLPELNIDISVKRMSYLLSAISLTLKGKI